jgi:integrase/recombinase XerD
MPVEVNLAADDGSYSEFLDAYLEGFLDDLWAQGFAERWMPRRRRTVESFARWARCAQIAVADLSEAHVAMFVEPLRSPTRLARARGVLRRLLQYLDRAGALTKAPIAPAVTSEDQLLQAYLRFLRQDRGLSPNSVKVYGPFVRTFLAERAAESGAALVETIDARTVRAHLLARARTGSPENARLLATSLRSFLRYLFLCGKRDRDLSVAVPMVRKWRQANVPTVLSPDEVERTLSAPDRDTPTGRRNHAILLLLARLGLRAGEVVTLELSDLHWRQGEIVVRGKGANIESLPLPSDVGEALALYLQKDRTPGLSPRVFLRAIPPYVGLTGPAAVGHVVRSALARAGLHSPSRRGAAHLFRHSLATRMIRNGASLVEISEILRHHSPGATEIYAKVDFESLRGVARPWPGTEDVR